jgi:two-component system CheB/CheR fusion protein
MMKRQSKGGLPEFPIVGIGASAGGLEAIEKLLRAVPAESGMAFVVVQHLDPTHAGMLPELLQRATGMRVVQVADRMRIEPDCVYVIPPNKDMSVLHGALHLFEPAEPRGLRLPIDFFLRSLAADLQALAVGVILSGMGSDGTVGLREIKDKGGLALVQEPASAKFDNMPRSAIEAGVADVVATAEEIPGKIRECLRSGPPFPRGAGVLDEKDRGALEKVVILLRARTGQDFSLYKKNTIQRRIERRMGIQQIGRIDAYVRYLQSNPQELELLFKELLIGVTSFFRDPAAWDRLRDEVLPALLANPPSGGVHRAWSTGCSTGEEAYSLAMAYREAQGSGAFPANARLQIFATDLDRDAIDRARRGLFPVGIAADVSPERLDRFFVREPNGLRIAREIREMVTFATQNVIMDPPFTKLDLLLCRNLLIYLTPELQKKLLPLFHYCLNPGGVLFLGSSESVGAFHELFHPVDLKARLFRKRESLARADSPAFPASFVQAAPRPPKENPMDKPAANLQTLAEQLLLQHFSPPAVLVNDQGDILFISGRTGKYLEPAAGKANWNLFAMAREGIRASLGAAFQKALREKEAVVAKGVAAGDSGEAWPVEMTVRRIEDPEPLRGLVMIVFAETHAPPARRKGRRAESAAVDEQRFLELEQELQQSRDELATVREGMQCSQEELKSANEELQSTNEELQSTNEELTTSREEMQSLNEELQSVNAEQQARMDELARANNDMRNLLNSTEIVTVFLDRELRIRRFTTGADRLFKLIPGDVGRPLSDIANELDYPGMTAEATEVLRTLAYSEKQIVSADGRWYAVRIMPYRTADDVIGGVVLTFADITAFKQAELELRDELERLKRGSGGAQ